MSNTKVLQIITRLNIGGTASHVIIITHELNKIGYKVILVKGTEGKSEGDMMDFAEAKGVEPYVIPRLGREVGFRNDIVAFYKIYRLIKKEKPKIVHTHTAKAGALGRIAAWLAGVPVILHTFHGHVLTGYFGRVKSWVFIQVEKMLALISTKLIIVNDEIKKELIDMGIGEKEKFEVVPAGLELKPFFESEKYRGMLKKELGLPGDSVLIGIVGRLVPIKGHKYFLEAAKIILDTGYKIQDARYDDSELKFVIVGDGDLRQELEDYSNKLGISGNVIFTGFRQDLPKIYADLDIVALTSINEALGLVLVEAMASGKPVVATNVGGVPSLVKHGVNGLLIKSQDVQALSDAIIKLLNDSDLRQKMGREGRSSVFPRYDISQLVKRVDLLYTQMIADVKK